MPKLKLEDFEFYAGRWYYKGMRATQAQIQQKVRMESGEEAARRVVKHRGSAKAMTARYRKYFNANTKLASHGHIEKWAKPMTLKGGTNPNMNYTRAMHMNVKGKAVRVPAYERWGATVNSTKPTLGNATVLKGSREWIRQLEVAIHAVMVNAEHFRILVGQRAIRVFQNSFKYQKMYTNQAQRWSPLASYTLQKRAKRGTGSKILYEYGDLYNSFRLNENKDAMTTSVYTDIVPANASHHKKVSLCYAGYHNEGKGTYGRGWRGHKPKPYVKRQFMGHSSHLDPYTDAFINKMMKNYLFDSVFMVRKLLPIK